MFYDSGGIHATVLLIRLVVFIHLSDVEVAMFSHRDETSIVPHERLELVTMGAWLRSAVVRDVTDVPRKRQCIEQGLRETYVWKGYL